MNANSSPVSPDQIIEAQLNSTGLHPVKAGKLTEWSCQLIILPDSPRKLIGALAVSGVDFSVSLAAENWCHQRQLPEDPTSSQCPQEHLGSNGDWIASQSRKHE
jgi:hypothetical protein